MSLWEALGFWVIVSVLFTPAIGFCLQEFTVGENKQKPAFWKNAGRYTFGDGTVTHN